MIVIFILGGVQTLYVVRLGVVKDQAGKSRIVGITNYWVQVALRPLHLSLFNILKKSSYGWDLRPGGALETFNFKRA
jgi:hypothetical protein